MAREELEELSKAELIELILGQVEQLAQLQADYEALKLKFEKKGKPPPSSKNSSQPPSRDQKGNQPKDRRQRRHGPPLGHVHLLQNLLEAVERLLKRRPKVLRQAAAACSVVREQAQVAQESESNAIKSEHQESKQPEKTYREIRFEEVKVLLAEGFSQREIARRVGVDRRTVAKYFHLEAPPIVSRQNSSGSKALPYLDYVQKRWDEGCHNLTELLSELQAQGFPGSYASLHRAVHGRLGVGNLQRSNAPTPKPIVLSPRQAAWAIIRPESRLREQQNTFRSALCEISPEVSEVYELSQSFRKMIEERAPEKLDNWLEEAEKSQVEEFQRFAASLRTDYDAVKAALIYSWSNGQVEGQVNRLKLIKRQMYGRAGFSLLRKRVLGQSMLL